MIKDDEAPMKTLSFSIKEEQKISQLEITQGNTEQELDP